MTHRYPKWTVPALSFVLGAICLVAFWIGGNESEGWFSFAVMTGFGLVFVLGGRSELIRGLRGDGRDEYWATLDRDATTIAGLVLICAVIALAIWEWAHGRSGSPYAQLGALAGVVYLLALAGLRMSR
jgi:hypothetical protein